MSFNTCECEVEGGVEIKGIYLSSLSHKKAVIASRQQNPRFGDSVTFKIFQ